MAEQIQGLMLQGHLYAGSDGSEKEGIGAHAYGFTSGIIEGVVWGGAGKTPGGVQEMASLRSEHAGAIGILLVLAKATLSPRTKLETVERNDKACVLWGTGPLSLTSWSLTRDSDTRIEQHIPI